MKILEHTLKQVIKTKIKLTLHESQSGFSKIMRIQDHLFTMKKKYRKCISPQQKMTLLFEFINLEKAFGRISRQELWQI